MEEEAPRADEVVDFFESRGLAIMERFNSEQTAADHDFVGIWHIYEMELWDSDYYNMEVQAFIEIGSNNLGDFQFGLVSGYLNGYIEDAFGKEIFVFTWEGQDEMDPVTGSGWLKRIDKNAVVGSFNFHLGDRSRFGARRAA